jgi:DNA-binding response OmpR family regulator
MGAWHYMTKPFDLANLLRVIDDVLEVPVHQLASK